MIDQSVLHIMEYMPIDRLGRGKAWLYAGTVRSEDEVDACRQALTDKWSSKGRQISFRSHRYSHAHGKNA